MNTDKLSVSPPKAPADFMNEYQSVHACKTRSEIIQEVLNLLCQKELKYAYHAASVGIDPIFEVTAFDGLDD